MIGLIGLALLAFAPPTQGRILLVPLTPAAAALLPVAALERHARLIAAGPFPGSIIVDVRGGPLFAAMLAKGSIALAAPTVLCGGTATGRQGV